MHVQMCVCYVVALSAEVGLSVGLPVLYPTGHQSGTDSQYGELANLANRLSCITASLLLHPLERSG